LADLPPCRQGACRQRSRPSTVFGPDYDQAIRINPNDAVAFLNRGVAYAYKGQYDRAIQDCDQAIRFDPNFAVAFSNRGLAKRAKGDSAGGDADIAKAKQLNPNVGN
jgi:tetratricopeptide (TPR) repeat protein